MFKVLHRKTFLSGSLQEQSCENSRKEHFREGELKSNSFDRRCSQTWNFLMRQQNFMLKCEKLMQFKSFDYDNIKVVVS